MRVKVLQPTDFYSFKKCSVSIVIQNMTLSLVDLIYRRTFLLGGKIKCLHWSNQKQALVHKSQLIILINRRYRTHLAKLGRTSDLYR
jgi:hypothetical protein